MNPQTVLTPPPRPERFFAPCLVLLLFLVLSIASSACKSGAKESAANAAKDVVFLSELIEKDVGEIERGLPEGASRVSSLVSDGRDPRQDVAGVRHALARIRRDVMDLNVAKSTFFALADPAGVAIRNDLEEDVMAGQNLTLLFPALSRAGAGFVTTTGGFPPGPGAHGPPDKDWIAATPVRRPDGSTGALLVTGWSYRYFARHLQSSLESHLLEAVKASGSDGKLPIYYVALFDPSGVYSAPLTPQVDEQALDAQSLVSHTAGGLFSGTMTITDRDFGFAALRAPKLGTDVGVAVLRSDL